MDFSYGAAFLEEAPEAYERLLLDAMVGDPTLFIRTDEVEQSWRVVEPVLAAWEDPAVPVTTYRAGTWGPPEADALIEADGRRWRRP
jgi:glucose-6-phosphate 1-dehydrogenase